MGMYRTSFQGLSQQSLRYLGHNSQTVQMLQKKLATGKSISDMSDSPLKGMQILDLKTILSTDTQYKSNISTALSEVQVTDSAVTSATDLIQRAKELATQGASFGNDQNNMNAIATEIDQLITQMVQLGNTTVGGRYIFGGKQTQTAPFAAAGNDVTYGGNAPGVAWQRQIEVSENTALTYNLNGESVFFWSGLGNSSTIFFCHSLLKSPLYAKPALSRVSIIAFNSFFSVTSPSKWCV